MKLATYRDGSRDGQLVVVSQDLGMAHYASGIATRLQQVLDDWNFLLPQLQDLSQSLNQGKARHAFPFDPALCMAPLPRAYQRVGASAYGAHVDLLRQAEAGAAGPQAAADPLLRQGVSDPLLGPCDDIVVRSEDCGIDFEAGLAVITGDVAAGATPAEALEGVRLLMLGNEVALRQLAGAESARGCGFVLSRPAMAFAPVAVTPDEVSSAWQGGRVNLPVQVSWNGKQVGRCEAGTDMNFHFGQLISYLCKTRRVAAGTIIGSGPVSNADRSRGYACIAEKRALETLEHGTPKTDYLRYGDTVRLEMKGPDGLSIFGAIDQNIAAPA
ncbi:fumarylacetoacetate hydrolase family protein [Aquabacterium sp. A7-Y]|uniref:fumarylacetoacetate hydrolase family protein n=1 Tax=Aquabacterium sp. A7-Y TaxID=1349605 RepID=UPI00223D7D65|nr:fumarylacetoacetate hydrolase family protein [Aquabacterium sp. A7-Y]MCW7539605.1 fumarylacetoacetate hydrolase family protein [Aquabacterium sp. A7-Y]